MVFSMLSPLLKNNCYITQDIHKWVDPYVLGINDLFFKFKKFLMFKKFLKFTDSFVYHVIKMCFRCVLHVYSSLSKLFVFVVLTPCLSLQKGV